MNPRLRNHLLLAALTGAALGISVAMDKGPSGMDKLSIVSAYLCLLLFAAALLIGPLRARASGAPVLNSHLRRDIAIWGGINGLLHFWLANVLAMTWEYIGIFVENAPAPPSAEVRDQLYLWGTIFGYVVAVLILVLLLISSDRALRKIGTRWWKRLQRLAYVIFVATVAHAFAFQVLESRPLVWVVTVAAVFIAVLAMQIAGRHNVNLRRK